MSDIALPPPPTRRYDLDWIRVGAFMLLILYHVGMFYVPWDYHVKSTHEVAALEPVMLFTNPWRLTLLFLVSGCATRFMADSFRARGAGWGALAGSRILRLAPPLLFGMFVIVPPQSYFEIIEAVRQLYPQIADPARSPILADFWVRYATASGGWCGPDGDCLVTPTWNHLWFVAYLLVYSLALCLLMAVPGLRQSLQRGADRLFRGWGLVVWPLLYLALIRWVLAPQFEITHALIDDWYNHALSFGAFLFGYLTVRSEEVRQGLMRLRWPALAAALASYAAFAAYAWIWRADDAVPPEALRQLMRVVYSIDQWAFIVAILGFGAKHLNHGGPVLRYLTVGVFPFYIIHQTIIVVLGHTLKPLGLSFGVEASVLILATFTGCFATYEIARRLGWLGLLLGVRPERKPQPEVQAANRPPLAA